MGKSSIQSLLKNLPSTPGVYRFKNDEGTVLYVGQAKNLKNRVRSYFQKQNNRPIRTQKLIEKTIDLEWTEVGSDIEAIFLETNLIKELRPKYNVLMKDDKNWVYIKITKDELFPRIKIVRKVENDKARYFGPSTAAGKLKKTLLLLQKLFMYRTCDLGIDWRNDEAKITKKTIAFPCLDYHIKRCAGPCISKISPEEYGESIRKIELFLEGKTSEIEGKLKKQMADCVAKKAYEKAGILRDKLQAIDGLIQKQLVTSADHSTMDVLAFTLNEGKAYFTLFALRDGKLLKQENFVLSASGFESGDEDMAPEVLETFLFQYYSKAADIPPQIFVPAGLPEMDLFHDWIKDRAGKVVKLKTPQKGKKHKLLDLAKKNALSFQKQQIARWAGFEEDDMESLEELARVLEMKKKPKRIEAYDISHLGGTDTVASMVVFENGKSKKSDYRKFRLRTLEEGEIDDFKSMTEILKRRLRYISVLPKGVTVRKATKSRTKDIDELRGEWHDVESDVGETFSEYFVAFFEKKVVGIMRMTPGKDGKFLMRSLYVKHEHRGSGIAYGLMAYASKKLKAKRVYLSCFDHMKDFYENFGFDLVKSIPKEFTDLYLDVLIAENPKSPVHMRTLR